MEKLSIQSFLDHGHEYHLYTYEGVPNAPDGARIKDGSEIIESDKIFRHKETGSYADFSDIFRYKLLLSKGDFWVDTDVVCCQPFTFTSRYVFASEFEAWKPWYSWSRPSKVTNCVIRTPPDSEIMNYCYEKATGHDDPAGASWGTIGPELLGEAVDEYNMHQHVVSPRAFCPINWWEWERFVNGTFSIRLYERIRAYLFRPYAYHLWNSKWALNGATKSDSFPKNSIYEQLKKKHAITSGQEQLDMSSSS
ncbi:hypothetical protein GGP59_003325 [Salinibacter ruber]|nr:hypothetical protein [Salinibacter ruber]